MKTIRSYLQESFGKSDLYAGNQRYGSFVIDSVNCDVFKTVDVNYRSIVIVIDANSNLQYRIEDICLWWSICNRKQRLEVLKELQK